MRRFLFFFFLLSFKVTYAKELLCPADVADPAIVFDQKKVLVMGTGTSLVYGSLTTLMKASTPTKLPLKLFHEVILQEGVRVVELNPDELPWDLQFYTIKGKKFLYGGVMTPRENALHASWPQDNISRRIKVATYNSRLGGWVFRAKPVFGEVSHSDWRGHSYGQQVVYSRGRYHMLHEEITRDGITEIYLRALPTPYRAGDAKKIVSVEHLDPQFSRRADGGQLLEGPRYTKIRKGKKTLHLIYFSTGDFPTNNYATRVAFSETGIQGPYKVLQEDLTETFRKENKLYGVGRAFPFVYQNKHWIIFHGAKEIEGVDHSVWPSNLDQFKRCLFITPVNYTWKKKRFKVTL